MQILERGESADLRDWFENVGPRLGKADFHHHTSREFYWKY